MIHTISVTIFVHYKYKKSKKSANQELLCKTIFLTYFSILKKPCYRSYCYRFLGNEEWEESLRQEGREKGAREGEGN